MDDELTGLLSRLGSYAILMARPLGFTMTFPLLLRAEMGVMLRSGFAFALTLPVFAYQLKTSAVPDPSIGFQSLLAIKEAAVGALTGVLLGIPFWSIQMVGEYIDSQRGVSNSYIQDPALKTQASVTNEFLTLVSIAIFTAIGGFYVATDTLYSSYVVWSPMQVEPHVDDRLYRFLLHVLDSLSFFMLVTSGPVILIMLATDIAIMFLGRLSPQFRVDQVAVVVKNILFVLVMILYSELIIVYFKNVILTGKGFLDIFLRNAR